CSHLWLIDSGNRRERCGSANIWWIRAGRVTPDSMTRGDSNLCNPDSPSSPMVPNPMGSNHNMVLNLNPNTVPSHNMGSSPSSLANLTGSKCNLCNPCSL